jgi:hypothetical protein
MSERTGGTDWTTLLGYALGIGICFMASLGVWLQYSTQTFTFWTGGVLSLGIGLVVGGGWFLFRHRDG